MEVGSWKAWPAQTSTARPRWRGFGVTLASPIFIDTGITPMQIKPNCLLSWEYPSSVSKRAACTHKRRFFFWAYPVLYPWEGGEDVQMLTHPCQWGEGLPVPTVPWEVLVYGDVVSPWGWFVVMCYPSVWGEHLLVPGEDLCVCRHKSPSMRCHCVTFQINVMFFIFVPSRVLAPVLSESVCAIR